MHAQQVAKINERVTRTAGSLVRFFIWLGFCGWIAGLAGCHDSKPSQGLSSADRKSSPRSPEFVQVKNPPREVLFWHFWGGEDLEVVRDVVRRFNASQTEFRVREVALPGNNLQAKLFLSIAGGRPPDLVNQDDPILADWGSRRLIQPLSAVISPEEARELREFLVPAARNLSEWEGELWGVCNGLDIRALYFNRTWLEAEGLPAPTTWRAFEKIISRLSPPDSIRSPEFFPFLPDHRRLWTWGVVFGGDFTDPQTGEFNFTHPATVRALSWMQDFSRRYGWDRIAGFRQTDQSLPGKGFPLLPASPETECGRYAMVLDGQWRVRDIERFARDRAQRSGKPVDFGVAPLPVPDGGRADAGWVNGNFFVIPRGAHNTAGAWAFMKFWIGLHSPGEAARTCAAGGWIPVSQQVVQEPAYQAYLQEHPLMIPFNDLASSPHQLPIPILPGTARVKRLLDQTVYRVLANPDVSAEDALRELQVLIQAQSR